MVEDLNSLKMHHLENNNKDRVEAKRFNFLGHTFWRSNVHRSRRRRRRRLRPGHGPNRSEKFADHQGEFKLLSPKLF